MQRYISGVHLHYVWGYVQDLAAHNFKLHPYAVKYYRN